MKINTIYIENAAKSHPNTYDIIKELNIKILFIVSLTLKFLIQITKILGFKRNTFVNISI